MKREVKYADWLIALVNVEGTNIKKGDIVQVVSVYAFGAFRVFNDRKRYSHSFSKEAIGTVFDFEDMRDVNPSLLMQAERVVNGDRNEQYSDPNIAFQEYADILSTTFDIHLTPEQICKVQMAVKLGRLKYKFKEDSLLDLMGYSEILNRLQK